MKQIKSININNLTKMITIEVVITDYRKYNLRIYIGKLLMKFGILIMDINGEIEVKK